MSTLNRKIKNHSVHAAGHGVPEASLPVDHISTTIGAMSSDLWKSSQTVHKNPELGFGEAIAHDAITKLLIKEGFAVKRHTYGLATSFEAEFGSGGRLVVYCAECNAPPDIGHACSHNLIAFSSVAAFIGLSIALKGLAVEVRMRMLGIPAEEALGGKIKMLQAGAFADDAAAAMMLHPLVSHSLPQGVMENAGSKFIPTVRLQVNFHGQSAHAGAAPWNGLKALDAAAAIYINVSMLRQHSHPDSASTSS